jgi:regulatory protein
VTFSAFDRGLKMLERRPHFRREVEQKLARAGCEGAAIDEAVDRLTKLGYLDDVPIAKSHAAMLADRKGYGAMRVRAELIRRGASPEAVVSAMASLSPEGDLDRARGVVAKWWRKGGADRAALARHLDRRGFDRRVIFTILKELAPDGEGESFAEE